uniref:Protein preY, mitochondrial n=1 Tax=Palpitomonas bilix TaxID=652834 RepID=A0A7S3DDD0_9EUKA
MLQLKERTSFMPSIIFYSWFVSWQQQVAAVASIHPYRYLQKLCSAANIVQCVRFRSVISEAVTNMSLAKTTFRSVVLGTKGWVFRPLHRALATKSEEFDLSLLDILACPLDKSQLYYSKTTDELVSLNLGIAYPIKDGIPCLVPTDARKLDETELKDLILVEGRENGNK